MSLVNIRAAILSKLQSAIPTAKIYDRERHAELEETLRGFYMTDGVDPIIKGGYLRRLSTRVLVDTSGYNRKIHKWSILLYQSLVDDADPLNASEIDFDTNVIEAVFDAFQSHETLSSVTETINIDGLAGIQLDESSPVNFAGVLCHKAQFTIQTQTSVSTSVDPDGEATGFNVLIDPSQPEGEAIIEAKEDF